MRETDESYAPREDYRTEEDSMGPVQVPSEAYWGAQTQRALENFAISGLRIHPRFLQALALIKKHAARVNRANGSLDSQVADAIETAAAELLRGAVQVIARQSEEPTNSSHTWPGLARQFPIDVFQTGSGTSWNMNANEVLANRANELLGGKPGSKSPVHPNDHVNKGQSSNDTIPSALYIACRLSLPGLLAGLQALAEALRRKEQSFARIVKLGRTHLQDAVPMTVGQEFGAFAEQLEYAHLQFSRITTDFETLPQGGTAVGTGLNAPPRFAADFAASLSAETRLPFRAAAHPFGRMAGAEPFVAFAGTLNVLAVALMKLANDLRLLASGPRGALGELILPPLQPGSSIMPGKVNPVIPELVTQVAAKLMGSAETIKIAAQNGPLQMIMSYPLLAHEVLSSTDLALKTCDKLRSKCIEGIEVDEERAAHWIECSLALVTPLAREIGYDQAAVLARRAWREKKNIRDIVLQAQILPPERINELLDPETML